MFRNYLMAVLSATPPQCTKHLFMQISIMPAVNIACDFYFKDPLKCFGNGSILCVCVHMIHCNTITDY